MAHTSPSPSGQSLPPVETDQPMQPMNINIVILASSIASLLLMLALLVLCVVVICAAAFTQQKRKQSKGIQLQGKVMRYNNYF